MTLASRAIKSTNRICRPLKRVTVKRHQLCEKALAIGAKAPKKKKEEKVKKNKMKHVTNIRVLW